MIPADYEITIYEGDDFNRSMTFRDDIGNPVNLTGYTAGMHIRNAIADAAKVDWTSYITLGGATGVININVPSANNLAWAFLTGVYDLELYAPSGAKFKLLRGSIQVIQEVTR